MTTATVCPARSDHNSHPTSQTPAPVLLSSPVDSHPEGNSDRRELQDNHPEERLPELGQKKRPGRGPRGTPRKEGRGARAGCSPRDAGAAAPPRTRTAATPAAREPRPCLQAVGSDQPPCRASRKERTVETDTRSRSRRQTRRPRLSLRGKTTGWGSRGGGHTNWSRHLLLPGACGVHTPRRRSEPARTERERLGRRGREEGGRRRSRVKNGLSRPYAEAGSYGRYSGSRPQSLEDTTE